MLKGVCLKLQVRADCRKEELESAMLNRSRIRPNQSRIIEKEILQIFKSGPNLQNHLGFQFNLSTYKRETLATFFKLLGSCMCYSL